MVSMQAIRSNLFSGWYQVVLHSQDTPTPQQMGTTLHGVAVLQHRRVVIEEDGQNNRGSVARCDELR